MGACEPVFAEKLGDGGGEDHLPLACLGLQGRVEALAGELTMDVNQSGVEVDVCPTESERLADPQAGVGKELE